jgi:hypothetical protein
MEAVSGGADTRVACRGKWQITWKLEPGCPLARGGSFRLPGRDSAAFFGAGFSVARSAVKDAGSVPLLVERLSIERDGRLVNVDNAPTNVPGREGHWVLEIENSASGRGGFPPAGA